MDECLCYKCLHLEDATNTQPVVEHSNEWLSSRVSRTGVEHILCSYFDPNKLLDPKMRKMCVDTKEMINRIYTELGLDD